MLDSEYKEEYRVKAGETEENEKEIRKQKKQDKKVTKALKNFDQSYQESAEYSTWVPPTSKLAVRFEKLTSIF